MYGHRQWYLHDRCQRVPWLFDDGSGESCGLVTVGWPRRQARPMAIAVLSLIEGALMSSRTAGDTEALAAAADQVGLLLRR